MRAKVQRHYRIYKIDKGIPISKSAHERKALAPLVCRIQKPCVRLEIGDSVNFKHNTEAMNFANKLRSYGQRAAIRRMNQGTRVWRVE